MRHGPRRLPRLLVLWSLVTAGVLLVIAAARSPVVAQGVPQVRIVHAIPDAGALSVTLDGQPVAAALDFAAVTEYQPVVAAVVQLRVAKFTEPASPLLELGVEVPIDRPSTVVLAGRLGSEPAVRAIVLADDLSRPAAGRAGIRFLNAAPGSGRVTVANAAGGFIGDGVAFGESSESIVDAGRYLLRAVRAETELSSVTVDAASGRSHTLVLIGQTGGSNPPVLLSLLGPRSGETAAVRMNTGPGSVLIDEGFADAGGILPASAPFGSALLYGYTDGEYYLRNLDVATRSLAIPGDFSDATIAVDTRLVGDIAGRTVSVGCRFTTESASSNRGYRLRVEPGTGVFRLVREDGPRDFFLRSDRVSPAIMRGSATNRLELTCNGSTIRAAINGVEVAVVQDRTYPTGPLVIGVGARSSGLTSEARFDNLLVTQR